MKSALDHVNTENSISFFNELSLIYRKQHYKFKGDSIYNVEFVIYSLKVEMPKKAILFSSEILSKTNEELEKLFPNTSPLVTRMRAKGLIK